MSQPRRFKIKENSGRSYVHLEELNGQDYTMCGMALDGCLDEFDYAEETSDKADCPKCIKKVKAYKAIKL